MENNSITPVITAKIVLFKIKDAYNVINTDPKKMQVNTILFADSKCNVYFLGPCRIPNDKTNKIDPNDHKTPNLRGFNAKTGNIKKLMAKQRKLPAKHTINPIIFSKLLNLNQDGSCTCDCESPL